MKKIIYRDWEVYLFRQDLEEMTHYFAVCAEMAVVCMSSESYWEAFQFAAHQLDHIAALIANNYEEGMDFELPF